MLATSLLLIAMIAMAPDATSDAPTAIVAPLVAKRLPAEIVDVLVDVVVDVFEESGGYTVLGPDALTAVLDREQLRRVTDDCTDEICYSEIAAALHADILITGWVSRLADDVIVSVVAVDPRRYRLLGHGKARRENQERFYEAAVRTATLNLLAELKESTARRDSARPSSEPDCGGRDFGSLYFSVAPDITVNHHGIAVGPTVSLDRPSDVFSISSAKSDFEVRVRYRVEACDISYWVVAKPWAIVYHDSTRVGLGSAPIRIAGANANMLDVLIPELGVRLHFSMLYRPPGDDAVDSRERDLPAPSFTAEPLGATDVTDAMRPSELQAAKIEDDSHHRGQPPSAGEAVLENTRWKREKARPVQGALWLGPSPERSRWARNSGIVIGGTGLAALGVAIGFSIHTQIGSDRLSGSFGTIGQVETQQRYQELSQSASITNVMFAIGGPLLALGGGFLFYDYYAALD